MTGFNQQQSKQIRNVLIIALVLNLFVSALKIAYGIHTQVLSVLADGFHSLADAGSSITGLLAVVWSFKPKDKDHHYGHQKFETLATLMISAFIGLTSWEILKHAYLHITQNIQTQYHPSGIWIMFVSMCINLALSKYEAKKAKELKSHILEADSYHTASDFWVSLSVLTSLIAAKYNIYIIDSIVALGISVYFAWIAFKLVRETTMVLSDAAFLDVKHIKSIAKNTQGIINCHHIRTRGRPGHAFLDLHIQVEANMPTAKAHELAHELEEKIRTEITGVHDILIHTEPYPDPHDEDSQSIEIKKL